MKLSDKVLSVFPPDNAGSVASNRFDFQKDWAICKILELHEKPDDYLVTFEYHDDIIVFDSSSDPQKVSFYQIKTQAEKKAHWTVNALLKRKKGKNSLLNSFLGKIYSHALNFGNTIDTVNFVTNAKIKAKLNNDISCESITDFCCADLCAKDLNNIITSIKKEHSISDLGGFKDVMFFKMGELDINNHSQLTKARLVDFIEINFPDIKYQITPLYRTIFDEVRKKSNVEDAITNFEELKKKKSISRRDFDNYMETVVKSFSMQETSVTIENRLNSEGASFKFILAFKRQAKVFEVERMDHTNGVLRNTINICKDVVANCSAIEDSLLSSLDKLIIEVKNKFSMSYYVDDDYLKTILLFQIYE